MNDDIKRALERLRDPTQRDWFRERCSWASKRKAMLDELAERTGADVWRPRAIRTDSRPEFGSVIRLPKYTNGEFIAEYRAHISASCIVDAFVVSYHAQVVNAGPERGSVFPFCEVSESVPLTASLGAVEVCVVPELERLGWRRMSMEEADQRVPEMGALFGVLTHDVNGWLDDSGPLPSPDDTPIRSHYAVLEQLYAEGPGGISERSSCVPSWIASLEAAFADLGRVEHLAPPIYPSMSWTIDLGEVENDGFHARFFSDVHVSKLVPLWYYSDRFVIKHANPEASFSELSGWGVNEIGYVKAQTELIKRTRKALADAGMSELEDYYLSFPVPSPRGDGFVSFGELAFRDFLRICGPAARVEEEGLDRNLRPRRGHLRGNG